MASLNFGVKANGSIANVELFGMKTDPIKTMSSDNKKLEVAWEDRENQDIIAEVAFYKKHRVTLGDEVKEFIADYDAVCYIGEKLREYEAMVKDYRAKNMEIPAMQVEVTGTIVKEPYISSKGEKGFADRFIIDNMKEVSDAKPGLNMEMTLFYNKDSFDPNEFKKEKRLTVDAHVLQYVGKSKSIVKAIGEGGKQLFMPQQVVFDATAVDFDDPKQEQLAKMRLSELQVSSNKKLYACHWTCSYINGAEDVPFDESQLTSKQKLMIELGQKTLDDFRPKGSIMGPKIKEIRLVNPEYRAEFESGVIEVDEYSMKDFEEMLVKFVEPENFEEVVKKATEKKAEPKVEVKPEEVPFELDKEEDLFDGMDLFGN